MSCGYKQCPEEAYLNRWAKRPLNNKNNRLQNTAARSQKISPKKIVCWLRHWVGKQDYRHFNTFVR